MFSVKNWCNITQYFWSKEIGVNKLKPFIKKLRWAFDWIYAIDNL